MDTAQWPQEEIMVKPIEDKVSNTNSNNNNNNKVGSTSLERKIRPKEDEGANCPRCNSSNTKFCYYNNYSLTQPRYFCKACKRYWTAGGSLRNIPVGGASRKNKRSSSSSCFTSSSPPSSKRISSHDLVAAAQTQYLNSNPNNNNNNNNNNKIHAQDLNLGFPTSQHLHQQFTSFSEFIQLPSMVVTPTNNPKEEQDTDNHHNQHYHHLSALELLNGLTSSRSLTPFIPMAVADPNNEGVYTSGYPSLQEYRPSLNFSLDDLGNGYNVQEQGHVENSGGRLLFPFEDLKQVSSTTTIDGGADHNNSTTTTTTNNNNNSNEEEHGDSTNGYWSGMLDAGGSW